MAMEPVRTFINRNRFNIKSEWKVLAVCFLVATILWLLIALNENYNSNIAVNVNYYNRPQDQVFTTQLPKQLRVSVNAKGWDLIGYYLKGGGGDIYLNLNDYRRNNFILTSRLKNIVQQQIEGKVLINEIYPDSISLRKEKQLVRSLPVELVFDISFEKNYNLAGEIIYAPDTVLVAGPAELVNEMKSVRTRMLKMENVSRNINTFLKLQEPVSKNIHYNVENIKISFPVDKLTEKVIEVPVKIVNQKFQGNAKLIPEKITLSYLTTLAQFSKVEDNLFEAVVDGKDMDTINQNRPLRVQLIAQPKYIYNVRMHQENVQYVITKPQ